jgi:DNA polymerase-3 subunit delta
VSARVAADWPVSLVTGADPTLRSLALDRLVDELLAGQDRSLALEDYTVPSRRGAGDAAESEPASGAEAGPETPVVAAILTALTSPPFLIERRVVVVRDIGCLLAAQATMIAEAIATPLEGVCAVFVAGGGRTPSALDKAIKAADAHVVAPEAEKTGDVITLEARGQHVKLTAAAKERIASHFGDDAGRVPEFIDLLHGAYGDGATLDLTDVEPYLGEVGTVPRYELTGAIDQGDTGSALLVLHRLLHASSAVETKPLHPMQIMATLVSHYQRMLMLDDPQIRTPDQAMAALGGRVKAYPARRALEQAQRLGTEGLREALGYLAQAELDLRGATGVPETTIIEVLVARLAALSRRRGAGSAGGRPSGRSRRR